MSPTQRRRSHPLTLTALASLAALLGLRLAVVSIPLAAAVITLAAAAVLVDLIRSRGDAR